MKSPFSKLFEDIEDINLSIYARIKILINKLVWFVIGSAMLICGLFLVWLFFQIQIPFDQAANWFFTKEFISRTFIIPIFVGILLLVGIVSLREISKVK